MGSRRIPRTRLSGTCRTGPGDGPTRRRRGCATAFVFVFFETPAHDDEKGKKKKVKRRRRDETGRDCMDKEAWIRKHGMEAATVTRPGLPNSLDGQWVARNGNVPWRWC